MKENMCVANALTFTSLDIMNASSIHTSLKENDYDDYD